MSDRIRNVMALVATVLAGILMFLTGRLMHPIYPAPPYFIEWEPEQSGGAVYAGEVLGGGIANVPLGRGPTPQADVAAELFRRGAPFGAVVVAGPPTDGVAPLIGVFDGAGAEVAMLGVDGSDLLYRGRTRARDWGLKDPVQRAPGVLDSLTVGDTTRLATDMSRVGRCFDVADIRYCGFGFTAGSAWALFVDPAGTSIRQKTLFDGIVLAVIAIPIGFLATPGIAALLGLALAWYAAFRAPTDTVLLPISLLPAILLMLGIGAGVLLRRKLRPRAAAPSPESDDAPRESN